MSLRLLRVLAVLFVGAMLIPTVVRADEAQIWILVKIVDRQVEGQKIEIQVPIEVLRQLGTLRFWDAEHEKVLGQLEGANVFNNYKNTKIGENVKVLSLKDVDADLAVVVSGREPRGGSASSLKVQTLDRTNNQSNQWAWTMTNLPSAVRTFFTSDIWGSQDLKARIEGIDRIEKCLEPLANVAPYSVIKLDGASMRIIVKTE